MSAPAERGRESRLAEFLRRPRRAVWVVAGPMMAGFLVHALYVIVDSAFVGRLGPEALAAVTFVAALFMVAIALTNGLATGITAMVAQAIGRDDREGADRYASAGMGIGLFVGVALAGAGLAGGPEILPLLGAEGETSTLAWEYFQVMCFGMPMIFASAALRSVLTGEGDARTPVTVMVAGTIINALLDPIFIFSLGLGIRGASIATLVAQGFALSALGWTVLVRRRTLSRLRLSRLAPKRAVAGAIAAIGLPAAAGQLVMSLGIALANRVVAEFGQNAVAGYGAGSKVDLVVTLPVLGLAGASVTVVGMFAGAGRADLVRSTVVYSYRWALISAMALGVFAFLSSGAIVGVFTDDPAAVRVGMDYLHYIAFAYPLMAFGVTSGRILQGLGHGMPSLVITAIRVLLVGTAGAYVAVYGFGAPIEAVWISFIAGSAVANAVAFFWVRSLVWRRDPTVAARG